MSWGFFFACGAPLFAVSSKRLINSDMTPRSCPQSHGPSGDSVVCSNRSAFAFGQYHSGVEATDEHDWPQESADHGPQHPTAQRGCVLRCVSLVRALAEEVLVRERRETENCAKQKEQVDVDVHGNLLRKAIRTVKIVGLPDLKWLYKFSVAFNLHLNL